MLYVYTKLHVYRPSADSVRRLNSVMCDRYAYRTELRRSESC